MGSTSAGSPRRTPLYGQHLALGARMVDFAGWDMPINYPAGVVAEHLATRAGAGLFDVSHMGRFSISGADAVSFLRRVLTNDAAILPVGRSHYTLLANAAGGALDDAYLCRFVEDEFLLVVNAANRQKDWDHLVDHIGAERVELVDVSDDLSMISLQGPTSENMLASLLEQGSLPEAKRNALSYASVAGGDVMLSRTGYTGEPVCFEILASPSTAQGLWSVLVDEGATPTGLAARDTLRLEAGLPLYGHEQGLDPEGREIPILSCPVAAYGVNLSPTRGDFIGRQALERQKEAARLLAAGDHSRLADLPRTVFALALVGRGIARAESQVQVRGKAVGWVTSGTMVPYWRSLADGVPGPPAGEHGMRSICLAYLDSRLSPGDLVDVDIRGKSTAAAIVQRHMRADAPPHVRPVLYQGVA